MNVVLNPAELSSIEALDRIKGCINNNRSFKLEAGAGAGKTYSLIESLKYIIKNKTIDLSNKRIACITYTNVAKEEIQRRTDNHPLIFTDTIHSFCWELIQPFQVFLRGFIGDLNEKWKEKVKEIPVNNQKVKYDLGFAKITDSEIFLHHDDVIRCMSKLLIYPKFQKYIKNKFPIIFIDEYQDTDKELAKHLVNYLIENDSGILFGFFGDHWQKIYGKNACGLISSPSEKIEEIDKKANFRSDKNIVKCLNNIRKELPQHEYDPASQGTIRIFHSNDWVGKRLQGNHWKGDLPPEDVNTYISQVKSKIIEENGEIDPSKTKILFLTNNLIALEQGFKKLASCFDYGDDFLKKNDAYIKFFLETFEPCITAFKEKKFGIIFQLLGYKKIHLSCQKDKRKWSNHFEELIRLRGTSTIGSIIKEIKNVGIINLPIAIINSEDKLEIILNKRDTEINDNELNFKSKKLKFHDIQYQEVISLGEYIEEKTPFSTKHGIKGAEFDNILAVFGRGWNQYNWDDLLKWMKNGVLEGKEESYERNRNLFYVCCSRAKHSLTLLFTQYLSDESISTLEDIFGSENIIGNPFN